MPLKTDLSRCLWLGEPALLAFLSVLPSFSVSITMLSACSRICSSVPSLSTSQPKGLESSSMFLPTRSPVGSFTFYRPPAHTFNIPLAQVHSWPFHVLLLTPV